MKKLKIKQVRSGIGRHISQKRTLEALGLRKMQQEKVVKSSPEILGLIDKVKHLITVEEVK